MADRPSPTGSASQTVWIDEKNGRRPWAASKVGWLVALPLMGLLIAATTPWAIGHIEDRLADEARSDLEAAGIDTTNLEIDFDYRDGDATGALPDGVDAATAEAAVDARLLRSFDVVIAEPAIAATDVAWRQTGGKITLTGVVANDADRQALLDAAAAQVGDAAVVDELSVGGAGGDGAVGIGTFIATMLAADPTDTITGTLSSTLSGDAVTVRGSVATAATAAALDSAGVDAPVSHVVDVTIVADAPTDDAPTDDAESEPSETTEPVAMPLEVGATLNGGVVTLTGTVGSEAQRERLVAAADGLAPVVVDRIAVVADGDTSAAADSRVGAVETALTRLTGASGALVVLTGNALTIDVSGPSDVVAAVTALTDDLVDPETTVSSTVIAPPPSDAAEIAALQAELDGLADEIRENVLFTTGSAQLHATAEATLDRVVDALNRYPSPRVEVSGHTDDLGSADLNRRLSEERAAAVVAYLIDAGVDGTRLTARGVGPDEPVADNETAEGRALNRRVEFTASSSD